MLRAKGRSTGCGTAFCVVISLIFTLYASASERVGEHEGEGGGGLTPGGDGGAAQVGLGGDGDARGQAVAGGELDAGIEAADAVVAEGVVLGIDFFAAVAAGVTLDFGLSGDAEGGIGTAAEQDVAAGTEAVVVAEEDG